MKVTKAYEVSSNAIRAKKQMPLKDDTITKNKKRFDEFTATQTKQSYVQNSSQTVEQVANALRKQYPWVSFTFTKLGESAEDIAQFVASAESGIHLVVDPDMLEWMAEGNEAWTQGIELISKTIYDIMHQNADGEYNKGAVIAADGEITLWTAKWEKPNTDLEKDFEHMTDILERMNEISKQNAEQQKKMKMEQKKKLNYQMGKDMARLAKGMTDKDIRSLISSMYSNRQKIATASQYNRKEVQTALAQIDYVIGRARAKIRHLKEEENINKQLKKAEEKKEEKRRLQLEQELKSRRRNRMARERAAIYEDIPDFNKLRDKDDNQEIRAKSIIDSITSGPISVEGTVDVPTSSASSSIVVSTSSGVNVEVTISPMV